MRFFLIDKIIEWKPGERAAATKNISLSEDFFDDHFPRRPIMPGVLILEGMAQLSGILLEETVKEQTGVAAKALMTIIGKTKFKDMVRPGDVLTYRTELQSFNEVGGRLTCMALRGGDVVTTTTFTFGLSAFEDDDLYRDRNRLLELWLEGLDGQ